MADAVRKRRIADHQIKPAGEVAAGVVLATYTGFRMDEAGNPGRHRIVFDAGELRCTAQSRGQHGNEQASAHTRLERAAAGKPKMPSGVPQRPDEALGGVVGILRRTLQGRIFCGRHRAGEITPDLCPAIAVSGRSGQRKAVLSEVGGAEAHKTQQSRLLHGSRRTAGRLDLLGEADRRDVVTRASGPAACESAVAFEDIVATVRDWPGAARGRCGVTVVRVWCVACRDIGRHLYTRSKNGAVEQSKGELRSVGHTFLRWRATARAELRSVRRCGRDGSIAEASDRSDRDELPATRSRA
jgi:hypothetical protein